MKNLVICIVTIIVLCIIISFSDRDISIRTLHFSNAWRSAEKNSDQYLLISNPNLFMEGMMYTIEGNKITEKNMYMINSSHNKGTLILYTYFKDQKKITKRFSLSENDPQAAIINDKQWVRVFEPTELDQLRQLIIDEKDLQLY